MSDKLKSSLRIISVIIAVAVLAMYFGLLPFIDIVDEFYVMVVAYGLLLYTLK